ncbi:MAG: insulinase family protein [Ruminococcus sp.]|nr:insulinase family protein [Ruminococcus sp.]
MSAYYERSTLSESIGFNVIIDPKFKTNSVIIRFITPLSKQKSAGYALAASLLTTSCSKYPTQALFNRKMNKLYGGSASVDVSKFGDYQIITASFSALCNRYALDNEDVLGELIEIIENCLFEPNIEKGRFSENEYTIKVKDLLDTIEAEINNKRSYAIRQCSRIAYKNEPASLSSYGTQEEVLKLTPQSTYEAYKELLCSAALEIFLVSPQSEPSVADKFSEMFLRIDRSKALKLPNFITPSPLKSEAECFTETLPVAQCKMVLTFKPDGSYDHSSHGAYVMFLMNIIFGATPFSLLFANVREKLSLCYYCSSSYSESKQSLIVDCGVLKANIETAKEEILKQLENIASGAFSDELLENARMSAYNSIKSLGYTPSSYIHWYFKNIVLCEDRTVESMLKQYESITREEIMSAAASLKLDTIYIMEAEKENEEEAADE